MTNLPNEATLTQLSRVLQALRSGKRLDQVADENGIRTRVVKLAFRFLGIGRAELRRLRSPALCPTLVLPRDLRVLAMWHEGRPSREIAQLTGAPIGGVLRLIHDVVGDVADLNVAEAASIQAPLTVPAAGRRRRRRRPVWTHEEMLDILKNAATLAWPLSSNEYEALRVQGLINGPSSQAIAARFNGWADACDVAGVECGATPRRGYAPRWSDDELLQFVREYLSTSETSTYNGYAVWAQSSGAPSAATLRNRLGVWADVVAAAR